MTSGPRSSTFALTPYETRNLAADAASADLRRKLEAEYDKQAKAIGFVIPDFADKPPAAGEEPRRKGAKKAK